MVRGTSLARILVVEDDTTLRQLISAYLMEGDHDVHCAADGQTARAYMKLNDYDLILFDWMLPDLTGIELCQGYRAAGGKAPVMLLTARNDKYDKATGLDAGADDYMVKPFEQVEFQARIRALLRRPGAFGKQSSVITIRELAIDTVKKTVARSGQEIELRPREYALLEFLMRHPGQSFTAEALFTRLWNTDAIAAQETVRMHIMTLRKKIDDKNDDPLIVSMRGRGYKIVEK